MNQSTDKPPFKWVPKKRRRKRRALARHTKRPLLMRLISWLLTHQIPHDLTSQIPTDRS